MRHRSHTKAPPLPKQRGHQNLSQPEILWPLTLRMRGFANCPKVLKPVEKEEMNREKEDKPS